jgi:hypothetical protein
MACPSEARTTAYLSGSLAPGQREAARAHAVRCAACRATVVLYAWLLADETPREKAALDAIEPRAEAAARALLGRLVARSGSRFSPRT